MISLKEILKDKKFVIGVCIVTLIASLVIIMMVVSLIKYKNNNNIYNTTTKTIISKTTRKTTNINEKDNELEDDVNEGSNSNMNNTTSKATNKVTTKHSLSTNKTTQKNNTSEKPIITQKPTTTKKTNVTQNNIIKKWTVKFTINENTFTQEIENGKLVKKPSNPNVPSDLEFYYWMDTSTGKEFNFNTKITKNYELSAVFGPKDESTSTNNEITSSPTNIYFTNENFIKTTNQNRVEVTWKAVENADSYFIYYSSTENGNYKEKIGVSTNRTRIALENDGYYKIQASNSDGKKGPMSKAIYVPANFTSNISSSITCNIIYNSTKNSYTYNGGIINISNPNNYNIKILSTKYNNGQQPIYTVKEDLGTTTTKNISYACFKYAPLEGLNNYYTVIAYKKGNNYFIYSNDSVEIKNFIPNTTVVNN